MMYRIMIEMTTMYMSFLNKWYLKPFSSLVRLYILHKTKSKIKKLLYSFRSIEVLLYEYAIFLVSVNGAYTLEDSYNISEKFSVYPVIDDHQITGLECVIKSKENFDISIVCTYTKDGKAIVDDSEVYSAPRSISMCRIIDHNTTQQYYTNSNEMSSFYNDLFDYLANFIIVDSIHLYITSILNEKEL